MRFLVVCLVAIMAAGCQTTDPYTGEQKTSSATTGVAIGAVAGAVLGAATGDKKDRNRRAAAGAVAGGAVGGGIGYYMDQQEAALRQELQGTGVQVRREGDKIYLIMPGNITFASGRFEIRGDFYPTLNSVAKVLKKYEKTAIRVTGHTDSVGSDSSNQLLSEQRATSVAQYLGSQQIPRGRIQSVGYGERYPVASNDSASGREANRRVELELVPL